MSKEQNPINNLRRKYNPLEEIGRTTVGTLGVGGSVAMIAMGESMGYFFLPMTAIILYQGINGLKKYKNQPKGE